MYLEDKNAKKQAPKEVDSAGKAGSKRVFCFNKIFRNH